MEDGSFLAGILSGLNDLNSNKTGSEIISFFANDDNNAYIHPNINNEGKIVGTNAIDMDGNVNKIFLNPNLEGSMIPTDKGLQKSLFWLDIGHELAHRKDFILYGDKPKQTWLTNPDDGAHIPYSEQNVSLDENYMRRDAGLPLRTHYVSQGGGGWKKITTD